MGRFGAVVEAEGVVAGVAAEGEEVKLVAVGELAVSADGFEVVVRHFREGLFGRRGVVRGVVGGHGEVRVDAKYMKWTRDGRYLSGARCRLLGSRQRGFEA